MADNTAIEWADSTWNPTVGCSILSPGCTNCRIDNRILATTGSTETPMQHFGKKAAGRMLDGREWSEFPA